MKVALHLTPRLCNNLTLFHIMHVLCINLHMPPPPPEVLAYFHSPTPIILSHKTEWSIAKYSCIHGQRGPALLYVHVCLDFHCLPFVHIDLFCYRILCFCIIHSC